MICSVGPSTQKGVGFCWNNHQAPVCWEAQGIACAPDGGYEAEGGLTHAIKQKYFHWLDFLLASQEAWGIFTCHFTSISLCVTMLFTVHGIKRETRIWGLEFYFPGSVYVHTQVCARCGGMAVFECVQTHTSVSTDERSRLMVCGSERGRVSGISCCVNSCLVLQDAER